MYHELYNLIYPLSVRMFTPEKDKSMVLWRMLLYCDVFYRTDEYMRVKNPAGGIGTGGNRQGRGFGAGMVSGTPEPRFCKIEQKSAYLQDS